ncbi:hypothetical protein [Streptomyces chryseus]|uniref:hypothetical protein n=1 Tax=Streptomyces chryseus TaxID=68186 RepID=UPI00110FBA1E|nr:hypothetical protein [Streptomyces chryseus]
MVAGQGVAACGQDGLRVAADVIGEPGEDGVDGFLFGEVRRGELQSDLPEPAAGGCQFVAQVPYRVRVSGVPLGVGECPLQSAAVILGGVCR